MRSFFFLDENTALHSVIDGMDLATPFANTLNDDSGNAAARSVDGQGARE